MHAHRACLLRHYFTEPRLRRACLADFASASAFSRRADAGQLIIVRKCAMPHTCHDDCYWKAARGYEDARGASDFNDSGLILYKLQECQHDFLDDAAENIDKLITFASTI